MLGAWGGLALGEGTSSDSRLICYSRFGCSLFIRGIQLQPPEASQVVLSLDLGVRQITRDNSKHFSANPSAFETQPKD